MKNITRMIGGCLLAASVIAPCAAYAADQDADRSHPSSYVKDSVITTKVKAKLAAEKIASLANIRVDTDHNGQVVLTGKVGSPVEEAKAISIARDTEGVKAVISKLRVVKDDD